MPSYYEALPIHKVAMDVAARVDAVVQRLGKGHHPGWASARDDAGYHDAHRATHQIERGPAQGVTVAVAIEEPESCGNVKRRRLPYISEREQEKSK
jgi:hypothetical protein